MLVKLCNTYTVIILNTRYSSQKIGWFIVRVKLMLTEIYLLVFICLCISYKSYYTIIIRMYKLTVIELAYMNIGQSILVWFCMPYLRLSYEWRLIKANFGKPQKTVSSTFLRHLFTFCVQIKGRVLMMYIRSLSNPR